MPPRPATTRRRRTAWGLALVLALVAALAWSERERSQAENLDHLAALVQAEPSPRWDRFILLLNKLPHVSLQTTVDRRAAALAELDRLGAVRAELAPALVQILQHPTPEIPGYMAARLLGRVGKPALPELLKLSEHPDPQVRDEVIMAFGVMGPVDERMLPVLARLLTDDNLGVSGQALFCLLHFGPQARPIEREVRAALNDASPRRKVLKAILWLRIDPQSESAMSYLLDTWQYTRTTPFWFDFAPWLTPALMDSGNAARAAVPILREWLTHKDPAIRLQAAALLWKFQDKPQSLAVVLDPLVRAEKPKVRAGAIELLGALGADARGSVSNLTAVARDQNNAASTNALAALKKIDPDLAKKQEAGR